MQRKFRFYTAGLAEQDPAQAALLQHTNSKMKHPPYVGALRKVLPAFRKNLLSEQGLKRHHGSKIGCLEPGSLGEGPATTQPLAPSVHNSCGGLLGGQEQIAGGESKQGRLGSHVKGGQPWARRGPEDASHSTADWLAGKIIAAAVGLCATSHAGAANAGEASVVRDAQIRIRAGGSAVVQHPDALHPLGDVHPAVLYVVAVPAHPQVPWIELPVSKAPAPGGSDSRGHCHAPAKAGGVCKHEGTCHRRGHRLAAGHSAQQAPLAATVRHPAKLTAG